ncbi:hypothetical protein [Corallococcus exercitus]|uniref:hypothetical protein n=1 Tax=Corallococcus exercitus TaxID=2316736 RepID=UPI0011C42D3A|nr:hypothetical protein [Corallococcus exercitus]
MKELSDIDDGLLRMACGASGARRHLRREGPARKGMRGVAPSLLLASCDVREQHPPFLAEGRP